MDLTALGAYLDGLMDPETAGSAYAGLTEKLGNDPDGANMLLCQLECARRDRERYAGEKVLSIHIPSDADGSNHFQCFLSKTLIQYFFPATCASEKIPFAAQTCRLRCAAARQQGSFL